MTFVSVTGSQMGILPLMNDKTKLKCFVSYLNCKNGVQIECDDRLRVDSAKIMTQADKTSYVVLTRRVTSAVSLRLLSFCLKLSNDSELVFTDH